MGEVERHVSPDGMLTLVVWREEDGDLIIGFDGYPWHTHGDILAGLYGGSPEDATRAFVDALLANETVIVVGRRSGEIHDFWYTDDPDEERVDLEKYGEPDETKEMRYWD